MARRRTVRSLLAAILTLIPALLLLGPSIGVAAVPGSAVPPDRLARLDRGVNITRWLWDPENVQRHADHVQTWVSDAQLRQIRAAGFPSVRLPVEPTRVLSLDPPGEIDPQVLADLDV